MSLSRGSQGCPYLGINRGEGYCIESQSRTIMRKMYYVRTSAVLVQELNVHFSSSPSTTIVISMFYYQLRVSFSFNSRKPPIFFG